MKIFKAAALILTALYSSFCMADIYPFVAGNKVELLEDARSSAQLKIDMVNAATDHVHIMTFFWDETEFPTELTKALIDAHERGVDVRVLTTYFPSLLTDFTGRGRDSLLGVSKSEHSILSFLALKSYSNLIIFNSIHEKVFLVDAQKAILGGRNISDSRFKGKDMEVLIQGPVVNQVQEHFHKMNEFVIDMIIDKKCHNQNSRKCLSTKKAYEAARFAKDEIFFPSQENFVSGVRARVLTHNVLIDQLKKGYRGLQSRLTINDDIVNVVSEIEFETLRGYNYFIIPTPKYQKFLDDNLAKNKHIEIVTNGLHSSKTTSANGYYYSLPYMLDLSLKGLKFIEWQGKQEDRYLHTKVMIFDEKRVIIGSHNFGVGSTAVSNEIALEIESPKLAQRLIDIFEADKKDPERAQEVDTEFIEKMNTRHRGKILFLHWGPIDALIRQLY